MNTSINAFELSDITMNSLDSYSTPRQIIDVVTSTYEKANRTIDPNFTLTIENTQCLFHTLNYTIDRIELESPKGSWESKTKQEKKQAIYNAMQRFLWEKDIV